MFLKSCQNPQSIQLKKFYYGKSPGYSPAALTKMKFFTGVSILCNCLEDCKILRTPEHLSLADFVQINTNRMLFFLFAFIFLYFKFYLPDLYETYTFFRRYKFVSFVVFDRQTQHTFCDPSKKIFIHVNF